MAKILFLPFSVIGGLIAGMIGKKVFEGVWSLVDKEEAPDPSHRDVPWKKIVPALLLEGAIFRAVRGVVDHASRQGFRKLTGSWPGEERPEPA
ncbi:MAG TPA: DUF4235 domain-containing protein [Solirubrobacteraceae bacterium]|jgi:hypothetical protein|nr:DUF4235 domain-containing protein [Solirubrobacteraceae bacterium]